MTEEIYRLAAGLARPSEEEGELLRLLCREAERRLTRQAGERRAGCRAARLRRQAERMMAPYCGGEGFAFLGVRG